MDFALLAEIKIQSIAGINHLFNKVKIDFKSCNCKFTIVQLIQATPKLKITALPERDVICLRY